MRSRFAPNPPLAALALTMIVLPALLTGCLASPLGGAFGHAAEEVSPDIAPGAESPPALPIFAEPAVIPCASGCYESTVAVDTAGRIFMTDVSASLLARSLDGGTSFERLRAPPHPEGLPPLAYRGDAMVHAAPDGRLYFSALILTYSWPGVVALLGVQVARSEDAGASWPVNAYVALPRNLDLPQLGADRQWLAFGPGETVYLVYQRVPPVLESTRSVWVGSDPSVRFARSDDGGRTWTAFSKIHPEGEAYYAVIVGAPVTQGNRILVPHFAYLPDGGRLRVAVSEDRGDTFRHVDVDGPRPEGVGAFFPALVDDGAGGLVIAWMNATRALSASRSTDGGFTWSEPVTLGDPDRAVVASPWLVAHDGIVSVAWFVTADRESEAELLVARGEAEAFAAGRSENVPGATAVGVAQGYAARPANTDFAHAVMTPEGHVVLVWGNRDAGEAHVAVEAP